jgi:hypothetical protein
MSPVTVGRHGVQPLDDAVDARLRRVKQMHEHRGGERKLL